MYKRHHDASMKRKQLPAIICLVAFVTLVLVMFNLISETGYHKDLDGRHVAVDVEYLNVRDKPRGEILDKVYYGDKLCLTGNVREYIGGDTDMWYETDCGWVSGQGIDLTPLH